MFSFQDNPTEYAKFQPIYNWTYTLFRCNEKSASSFGLYLGSDDNKNVAILVEMVEEDKYPALYPDPRALFIANKVIPPPTDSTSDE